eukprot:3489834-Heterocapsa_arctica.AAC.1
MRSLLLKPGSTIVVRKRYARHYFHQLQIGHKWHTFLGHPFILSDSGHKLVPVHCATPMGIAPSAGWAQGLTDHVAIEAKLPS